MRSVVSLFSKVALSAAVLAGAGSFALANDAAVSADAVRLADNGTLNGRVTLLSDSGVTAAKKIWVYLVRNGKVVQTARPTEAGRFSVAGVPTGNYSVVVAGPEGFATYSVRVEAATEVATTDSLEIDTIAVGASDFGTVSNLLKNYSIDMKTGTLAQTAARNKAGVRNVSVNSAVALVSDATINGETVVELGTDGKIAGQIRMIDSKSGKVVATTAGSVNFIRNGSVVATSAVDANGMYEIAGLQPGAYSVFASGVGGVAAFGVRFVAPEAPVATVAKLTASSTSVGVMNATLALDTAAATTALAGVGQVVEESYVVEDRRGGGGGGPGGGGGGNAAGIVGAALGAVGTGLGAAALADDNNGTPNNP